MAGRPTVGEFVRARRQVLGYSQERLSEVVGCSPETLKKWETATRRPGPALAKQLATALELDTALHAPFIAWVRGAALPEHYLARLLATLPTTAITLDATLSPDEQQSPKRLSVVEADYALPSSVDSSALRARQRMLEKVRAIWITGLLNKERKNHPHILLRCIERSTLVIGPLRRQFQELGQAERELAPALPIVQLFDDSSGELLILGAPGAGKTLLLLELAGDLLERAARNPNHPIPVIFSLSSWAVHRHSLVTWMIEELNLAYDVPMRLADEWIETGQVLPLLDGLDEMPVAYGGLCIEEINRFRQKYGLIPLAICSRLDDYVAFGSVRLKLNTAIQIKPLEQQQIDEYLIEIGREDLCIALHNQPGLYDLLRAPLMLTLFPSLIPLDATGILTTIDSKMRQRNIFEYYVVRMFERRVAPVRYSYEQTIRYLSWLARSMAQYAGSQFFIEQLHSGWLGTAAARKRYTSFEKLAFGFIVGVLSGGIWALGGGLNGHSIASPLTNYLLNEPTRYTLEQISVWLWYGLGICLLLGIVMAFAVWLATRWSEHLFIFRYFPDIWWDSQKRTAVVIGCVVGSIDGLLAGRWNGVVLETAPANKLLGGVGVGVVTALAAGLGTGFIYWRATRQDRIVVVETFKWSWRNMRWWAASGLGVGILLGTCYGFAVGVADGQQKDLWYGLILGLCNGLVGGLIAGVMVGVGRGEIPSRTVPNQGIWRSAQTALWVGGLTWLAMGITAAASDALALWLVIWDKTPISATVLCHIVVWNLINWMLWASSFGVGAGLLNGGLACIQHILVRLMLWREGDIPWDFAAFLDAAAERILLRKVGGAYQFLHSLLQDYFVYLETTVD